jgi:hypothetical protein
VPRSDSPATWCRLDVGIGRIDEERQLGGGILAHAIDEFEHVLLAGAGTGRQAIFELLDVDRNGAARSSVIF